jgi:hypothetical protein
VPRASKAQRQARALCVELARVSGTHPVGYFEARTVVTRQLPGSESGQSLETQKTKHRILPVGQWGACLVSAIEEYVKRAEECERLAGACIAESNREILLFTAMHWRAMAEDTRASACGLAPGETGRDPIALC